MAGESFIKKGIKFAQHDGSALTVKKVPMEFTGGAITPRSVVFYLDVDLFTNRIAVLRSKTVNDFKVKFEINYGQLFLVVTMTLITASRHSSGHCYSSINRDKNTMLLEVCQVPETYANLKSRFTLCYLKCVCACDLKVINWTKLAFQQTPLPILHIHVGTLG